MVNKPKKLPPFMQPKDGMKGGKKGGMKGGMAPLFGKKPAKK